MKIFSYDMDHEPAHPGVKKKTDFFENEKTGSELKKIKEGEKNQFHESKRKDSSI